MIIEIRSPFSFKKKSFNQINAIEKVGSDWFYLMNTTGNLFTNDTKTVIGQLNAYNFCYPVNSIVQKKTRAFMNGKIYIEDKNGNQIEFSKLKEQTKIFTNPNILQTGKQFLNQFYQFFNVFGEVFIYKVEIPGIKGQDYYILPNHLIQIYYKNGISTQFSLNSDIDYYVVNAGSGTIRIETNEILHYKNSLYNNLEPSRGLSVLYSCDNIVNNIMISIEARRTLMENKGPSGILAGGDGGGINSMPLTPNEQERIQTKLKTKYGLNRNQHQILLTAVNLRWVPMGFPTSELMLFEEKEDDISALCEAFDYPSILFGLKNQSTYNNILEGRKDLYTNGVIPDAEAIMDWINSISGLDQTNYKAVVYYDHLDIFQKSEKDKADAFSSISTAIINVLTADTTTEQKIYILVYFYGMKEDEAKKLVGNGNTAINQ